MGGHGRPGVENADRSALRVAVEIGRQAVEASSGRSEPDEIVTTLGELVTFRGAELSFWDPVARQHRVLVNHGYSPGVLDYLNRAFVEDCPGYEWAYREAWPQRMGDLPFDFRATETFREVLGPAGYDEGLTACLFTADGRYTGMLNLNTGISNDPDDGARELIGRLGSTLAQVTDASRTLEWLASTLEPEASAVAVSVEGRTIELPGCPTSTALEEPSVIEHARMLACEENRSGSFLYWTDPASMHQLRVVPAPHALLGGRRCALIVEQPLEAPLGLTAREIDVLTLISLGATNREIAVRLFMAPRTVSTHVEHILEKLGQGTRTGAATLAIREGIVRFPMPDR